jgi:hypothetical protein
MAKNGSFGFAEGSACGWGKTKCAIFGQAIEIHFFSCGGGVLIFLKRCNVGLLVCPISLKVVSFKCCCPPVKIVCRVSQFNFLVVRFIVAMLSNTLSANSWQ